MLTTTRLYETMRNFSPSKYSEPAHSKPRRNIAPVGFRGIDSSDLSLNRFQRAAVRYYRDVLGFISDFGDDDYAVVWRESNREIDLTVFTISRFETRTES